MGIRRTEEIRKEVKLNQLIETGAILEMGTFHRVFIQSIIISLPFSRTSPCPPST
jgi:hypothetical protein